MSKYTMKIEVVRFSNPRSELSYSGCVVSILDEGGGPYLALTTGDEPVTNPDNPNALYLETVNDIDDFCCQLKELLTQADTVANE